MRQLGISIGHLNKHSVLWTATSIIWKSWRRVEFENAIVLWVKKV